MRIGHGYDVHRLAKERRLVLGGVEIPFEYGLKGHSDADVLLHALCDAMLGAAGLGDIGTHFPDTDERYLGIDSRVLLRETVQLVNSCGYGISNVDITVVAQRPKLSPFIKQMISNISDDIEIPASRINIKATTEEGLGFTGSGEGIAAYAVCLLDE